MKHSDPPLPDITIKRSYEPASPDDGYRVLVDRLWPRGLSRERLRIDRWCKELAPSTELRQWFAHDASRWSEFRHRYLSELDQNGQQLNELLTLAGDRRLTLLYSARDAQHNNAAVLRDRLLGLRHARNRQPNQD